MLYLDGRQPLVLSISNSGTLAFRCKRNGTKLEKTSLSTNGCKYPCLDIENTNGWLLTG